MSHTKFGTRVVVLALTTMFSANAGAVIFQFTGECDDCAFNGNPSDVGFDPIDDGLTQSVSGNLSLTGLSVNSEGFFAYGGIGTAEFSYNGSSLINPFTIGSPFLFTPGLLESGEVPLGSVFTFSSSLNLTDPDNPLSWDFPDFCTSLGQQVLGQVCSNVSVVTFETDSFGNWGIFGDAAFDIGSSGQLASTEVPEPTTLGLLGAGLIGFAWRKHRA